MKPSPAIFFSFLLLSASGLFAASAVSGAVNVADSLCQIYNDMQGLLPPLAMLLVVLAAVIYAAGQVGSAEFRANSGKWATALIVGAVLSLVLILILPGILQLFNSNANCTIAVFVP